MAGTGAPGIKRPVQFEPANHSLPAAANAWWKTGSIGVAKRDGFAVHFTRFSEQVADAHEWPVSHLAACVEDVLTIFWRLSIPFYLPEVI